jgi:hypothetical protein
MCHLQIANALYYNPLLTLDTLNKLGVAAVIFNHWFAMLQQVKKSGARANFKRYACLCFKDLFCRLHITYYKRRFMYYFTCREHDKKVCCLGLTSLIGLPADKIPADALDRIFKATLDLLVAYKDQVAGEVSVVIVFHLFWWVSVFQKSIAVEQPHVDPQSDPQCTHNNNNNNQAFYSQASWGRHPQCTH